MENKAMSWWEIALLALVVALIVVPPRFDPAIRIKEWLDKR